MIKLNFVSLDNPYPPNYGGAIDIYYKIKALSQLNCKVILHCFYSERLPNPKLENYCEKVFYYPRKSNICSKLSFIKPYLVASRTSEKLLFNLLQNDYPIFFDGLQSTAISSREELKNRKKYLRLHNIESDYMLQLSKAEDNNLKKIGLRIESWKYLRYEKYIQHFEYIFTISEKDKIFYNRYHKNVIELPPFHGNIEVESIEGKGNFILYHGNFNVSENKKVGEFLLEEVFTNVDFPIKIAGKNVIKTLSSNVKNENIELIESPSQSEMENLIKNAHIHILPTFQATGVKLKLINSLYLGRHCIVNDKMIEPTPNLLELCELCNSKEEFISKIGKLISTPFSKEQMKKREEILNSQFNVMENAKTIIECISHE